MTEIAGNVEVTVPDNSLSEVNPEFTEGAKVVLTKDNVEQFVRYRDTDQGTKRAGAPEQTEELFAGIYGKSPGGISAKILHLSQGFMRGSESYMVTNMGNDIFVDFSDSITKKTAGNTHNTGRRRSG